MSKKLFDANAAMMVIAGVLENPAILHDQDNYRLSTEDFENDFYKIVFSAIYNLAMSGVETIESFDIDMYISRYPEQYEVFQKGQGLKYLEDLKGLYNGFDIAKFNLYYLRLKKFTILRDLEKNGFSTREFYNPDATIDKKEEEERRLNETAPEDIFRAVQAKLNNVEDNFVSRAYATTQKGADGIRELYLELKETPEVGLPLDGDILNYAVRGARAGKMYMNSAPTGHGKTRIMVGNACALSLPKIMEDGTIEKPQIMSKVLFITTEQQADEIQTLLLANVSGVNERKILYGNANKEEEEKIMMAIELIEAYSENFIIEVIPDPSIALLRAKIVKHILQNGVDFIFYDYIFSSPGLITEFSAARVREDVALMMLSNTIKEVAATYNVFVMTASQLNDRWEQTTVRNQNHIRGSKAIADKVDVGMVTVGLHAVPEEQERIAEITRSANIEMPNVVTDIYKNRRGEHTGIKIYRYFDYGTCRVKDLFMTDQSFNIIHSYEKLDFGAEIVDMGSLLKIDKGGRAE